MYNKITTLCMSCFIMTASFIPGARADGTHKEGIGNLQIKAQIEAGCTVKPANDVTLDFGKLTNISNKDTDAEVSKDNGIQIHCSKGTNYMVFLDRGQHSDNRVALSGHSTDQNMSNGKDKIKYALYSDAARTTQWSDPSYGVSGIGNGEIQKFPVYGRIFKQKTPAAGTYTDVVKISLMF